MMAWNPWIDSIRQAMIKPRLVRAKDTKNMTTATDNTEVTVRAMPATGASIRKSTPCSMARVVPPSACPSTMLMRGTGATSTPCRNPALRSSMTAMVAKIAVNKRTKMMVPG